MATEQIDQTMVDQMIERAVAFCADKTFSGNTDQTLQALRDGRCDVCDYFGYGLARQIGEYLGQMDQTVKAIYVFEPEYGVDDDAAKRSSGINLIAWVGRKSAALNTLVEALDASLSRSRRNKVGCANAKAPCYALDVQMVDDAEVDSRRGYGALVNSVYVRPIKVWVRAA